MAETLQAGIAAGCSETGWLFPLMALFTEDDEVTVDEAASQVSSLEQRGFAFFAAIARTCMARAYETAGEKERSAEELRRALAAFENVGRQDLEVLTRVAVGLSLWKQGERGKVIEQLGGATEKAELLLSDLRTDELLAAFLGGPRRWTYPLLVDFLAMTGRTAEAFDVAERARARGLQRLLQNQHLRHQPELDTDQHQRIEDLRRQVLAAERSVRTGPGNRSVQNLAHLRQDRETALLEVEVISPQYTAMVGGEAGSLAEVQRYLEPGTTLVSYFVLPTGRAMAWLVERDRWHWVPLF